MEILKSEQYINEKFDIKPVTTDRLVDWVKVKDFIKKNNLKWNPTTKKYDCEGNVKVYGNLIKDGKFIIKFGRVKGDFNCGHNQLSSLIGAPEYVSGDFNCSFNKLETLEGAPQEVNGFWCMKNNLTSLEGAPRQVIKDFNCSKNNLTSLKGSPQRVGGTFNCCDNQLVSLDSDLTEVWGDFECRRNPNIHFPKEKPSWMKGKFFGVLD